jgi:hypothetical protein
MYTEVWTYTTRSRTSYWLKWKRGFALLFWAWKHNYYYLRIRHLTPDIMIIQYEYAFLLIRKQYTMEKLYGSNRYYLYIYVHVTGSLVGRAIFLPQLISWSVKNDISYNWWTSMGPLEGTGNCEIKDISKIYKQYVFNSLQEWSTCSWFHRRRGPVNRTQIHSVNTIHQG